METGNNQELENAGILTPKQFRSKFQEIFEAETNFGSTRAARLELLENVTDIIKEYLNHDCSIVYLHGKLKEAGYTGSRKELTEWLVEKGMWTKRESGGKNKEGEKILNPEKSANVPSKAENLEKIVEETAKAYEVNNNKNIVSSRQSSVPNSHSKAPTIKMCPQQSVTNEKLIDTHK